MDITTRPTLQQFLADTKQGPYVSLYMSWPEHTPVEKLRIRFKNMLKHVKTVMAETYSGTDFAPYAAELEPYEQDPMFWQDSEANGIGMLTNGAQTYVTPMYEAVDEVAMVTEVPQILPLMLDEATATDFDILALNADSIQLYHNHGHQVRPVSLPDDAPQTLKGTLGTEIRGGELNSVSQGGGHVTYHGHNEKSAEKASDQRRFYQAVDQYLLTNYSNPKKMPLVLMGLAENVAVFREISKNHHLLPKLAVVKVRQRLILLSWMTYLNQCAPHCVIGADNTSLMSLKTHAAMAVTPMNWQRLYRRHCVGKSPSSLFKPAHAFTRGLKVIRLSAIPRLLSMRIC